MDSKHVKEVREILIMIKFFSYINKYEPLKLFVWHVSKKIMTKMERLCPGEESLPYSTTLVSNFIFLCQLGFNNLIIFSK